MLTANNIHKSFANHRALDGVSIEVPKGCIFGLLGPNGAGKTTLIRIINRITLPDEGEVTFSGHPLCAEDVANIGYLPEERGLYKKMKVGEQAVYLARLKGVSSKEAVQRLQAWFEKFGIENWWNKKLEELSKGMQQKVQFITTVVHRPELLIFDEPFSGFDPVNADLLKREIMALRDEGHTVIFSTHNMASVEEICDEIALVNKGKIVLSGNVGEVKSRFRTGLYELQTTSATPLADTAAFTVEDRLNHGGLQVYRLRKADGISNSDLVSLLAQQVEVRSFAEQLPSMNDIFIKTVDS